MPDSNGSAEECELAHRCGDLIARGDSTGVSHHQPGGDYHQRVEDAQSQCRRFARPGTPGDLRTECPGSARAHGGMVLEPGNLRLYRRAPTPHARTVDAPLRRCLGTEASGHRLAKPGIEPLPVR